MAGQGNISFHGDRLECVLVPRYRDIQHILVEIDKHEELSVVIHPPKNGGDFVTFGFDTYKKTS